MAWQNYKQLRVRMDLSQRDAWCAAADRSGLTMRDWIRNALDAAAVPPAPQPTAQQVIEAAQRKYRTAGHHKTCGCGDCIMTR